MNKQIKLSEVFSNVKNVSDLVDKLEEHKNNGVRYVVSYTHIDIEITKLIDSIEKLIQQGITDLDELGRAIMYQMQY